jgi:hypothetical protein
MAAQNHKCRVGWLSKLPLCWWQVRNPFYE